MEDKNIYDNYINIHKSNLEDWNIDDDYKKTFSLIEKNLKDIFDDKEKDVLELGSGIGDFANYLYNNGFKSYTGIEISQEQVEICENNFPEFNFINDDLLNFLENYEGEGFDMIYMSHLFEHFNLQDGEYILSLLKGMLKKDGCIVNIMPNAGAYFNATSGRYIDITHKVIYDSLSFSQLLKKVGFNNIEHRNMYIGKNSFQHFVHKVALKLFELFIQLLGYSKQNYYTSSLITIIRKGG